MSNEYELDTEQLTKLGQGGGFVEEGDGQPNTMFFQVFDGSICLKSKTQIDGWEGPVETENRKTKEKVFTYVKRFDFLEVMIVNCERRKKEFDNGTKIVNYNFTILGGGKKAILQTTYMDALLTKFLKVAGNIDFTKRIRISAFRKTIKGKDRQLISIRQGEEGTDSVHWEPVPFYWVNKKHSDGSPNYETDAVGGDGSILPPLEHDDEDDTWNSKEQNKFLVKHFVQNQLPKIKAIADQLGIKDYEEGQASPGVPEFSGGPVEQDIPVVTERPESVVSMTADDVMTMDQAHELRQMAKKLGKKIDPLCEKLLHADFDDLSVTGAAYLKYRLEKKLKKAGASEPDDSELRKELERQRAAKAKAVEVDDDDDDDDGPPPPKKKSSAPVDDDDDDDDDDDFGK